MKLHVTKAVNEILSARFEQMLLEGNFPYVEYSNKNGFHSYKLFEYNKCWTTFTKLVDTQIKHDMVDSYGIFSRKSNKNFLDYLKLTCKQITPAQVEETPVRFVTWVDGLLNDAVAEAMKTA